MNAPAERIAGALQLARMIRRLKEDLRPGELGGETVEQFVRRYSRVRLPGLDLNMQSEYDPGWPETFEREKRRLQAALAGENVIGVEHIGSTSIPYLSSKNILDIAVAMRAPLSIERQTMILAELGYQAYGESPIAENFSWFWRMGRDGESSFVVHTCPAGSQRLTDVKNFRDFMRAHPEERQRYVDLKRELAAVPGQSWLEYSVSKKVLVVRITARANAWAIAHEAPGNELPTPANDQHT
ncbi:MAG: GrpB family protein [Lysobacteraceae bacterium]